MGEMPPGKASSQNASTASTKQSPLSIAFWYASFVDTSSYKIQRVSRNARKSLTSLAGFEGTNRDHDKKERYQHSSITTQYTVFLSSISRSLLCLLIETLLKFQVNISEPAADI